MTVHFHFEEGGGGLKRITTILLLQGCAPIQIREAEFAFPD
jgi:hypothetical protein